MKTILLPSSTLLRGRAARAALLTVLLGVVLGSGLSAAQVYKWVDDKGVTHYSESPPPDKKEQAKKLNTTTPSGFGVSSAKEAKSAADLEADFKQRRIARDEQDRKETKAADDERKDAVKRCGKARQSLGELRAPVPLYDINEKGEKVYLEDDQRKIQIDETEAAIKRYCR